MSAAEMSSEYTAPSVRPSPHSWNYRRNILNYINLYACVFFFAFLTSRNILCVYASPRVTNDFSTIRIDNHLRPCHATAAGVGFHILYIIIHKSFIRISRDTVRCTHTYTKHVQLIRWLVRRVDRSVNVRSSCQLFDCRIVFFFPKIYYAYP